MNGAIDMLDFHPKGLEINQYIHTTRIGILWRAQSHVPHCLGNWRLASKIKQLFTATIVLYVVSDHNF